MISVTVSLNYRKNHVVSSEGKWWWLQYSLWVVVCLTMTHSRGSRCQWIPAHRSSWSSRQAGWCSGRGDRTRWMRCATPAFGCHWLPRQRCNCQSLWVWEMGRKKETISRKLERLVKVSSWLIQSVTLTLVGLAVVLELWTGFALIIVWAAAVEISLQAVALGLIVTWVGAARVILHLQMKNKEVEVCSHQQVFSSSCFYSAFSQLDPVLTSQVAPLKPCGHSHTNPSSRAWQRPLFRHGLLAQRFLWTSQCRPTNPAWQTHW